MLFSRRNVRIVTAVFLAPLALAAVMQTGLSLQPPQGAATAASGESAIESLPREATARSSRAPERASPFVLVVEPLEPWRRLPPVPPSAPLPSHALIVPVQGIAAADLVDTFAQPRSDVRRHLAIDILAPTGTPILAAVDGEVVRLFRGGKGGLTIYAIDPAGEYVYYYAHLDSYAQGLEEGATIRQGDVIGYVGHTGNAHESAPHLHFAIWQQRPGSSGWGGRPVNPYLALTR